MSLALLPNLITVCRCGFAFIVGGLILWDGRGSWLPLLAFAVVAATDFLDGWLARRLNAVSKIGAFLDPVADKLLVGISLLALSCLEAWTLVITIPTVAILTRDTIATGLRLFPSVDMPVSQLAKWKTALEMAGIAALLAAAPSSLSVMWPFGLVLIWIAAALSVYTLGLYLGAILADEKRPR